MLLGRSVSRRLAVSLAMLRGRFVTLASRRLAVSRAMLRGRYVTLASRRLAVSLAMLRGRFVTLATLATLAACAGRPPPAPALPPPPAVVSPAPAPAPDAPPMPFTVALAGTLPNGVTFAIAQPPERVNPGDGAVVLVVRAGTADETPAEAGAAHALFHLLDRDGFAYIEARAPDDEDDAAATTTTYTLPLVAHSADDGHDDDDDALSRSADRALGNLRHLVDGPLPTPTASTFGGIHDGAVPPPPAEWDGTARGRNAADRAASPEVVARVSRTALAGFRAAHYRADALSVIVVAGGDREDLHRAIVKRFGSLPKPTAPPPPRAIVAAPHPAFAIVARPSPTQTQNVRLTLRVPHREPRGEPGQRDLLVDRILAAALVAHLKQAHPDAIWSAVRLPLSDRADLLEILGAADTADDVADLVTEVHRLGDHGLAAADLAAAIERVLAPASANELADPPTSDEIVLHLAADLAAHAARGVPLDDPQTLAVRRRLAAALRPADIAAAARAELALANATLEIPPDLDREHPDLAARLLAIAAAPIEAWEDRAVNRPLMAPPAPPPHAIVATATGPRGLVAWTLANGVRVIVQPAIVPSRTVSVTADDIADGSPEVSVVVTGPGGWLRPGPWSAIDARVCGDLVRVSGVGDRSAAELDAVSIERDGDLAITITPRGHVLAATGTAQSLEVLAQLAHLAIAHPGLDRPAIARWLAADPARPAHRAIPVGLLDRYEGTDPQPPITAAMLAAVDADRARAAYAAIVGDLRHTTILVTGNITAAQVAPLAERYFATLVDPLAHRDPAVSPPPPPVAVARAPVAVGVAHYAASAIAVYAAPPSGDPVRDRRDLDFLSVALRDRLDRATRDILAITRIADNGDLVLELLTRARTPPAVTRADFADLEAQVAAFASAGPDATSMQAVALALHADRAVELETWQDRVVDAIIAGRDPIAESTAILDRHATAARATPAAIRALARRMGRPRVEIATTSP